MGHFTLFSEHVLRGPLKTGVKVTLKTWVFKERACPNSFALKDGFFKERRFPEVETAVRFARRPLLVLEAGRDNRLRSDRAEMGAVTWGPPLVAV